jgi:hypothetical protein
VGLPCQNSEAGMTTHGALTLSPALQAASFKPQEISNTMWGLARLGIRPSEALLVELFVGTDHR